MSVQGRNDRIFLGWSTRRASIGVMAWLVAPDANPYNEFVSNDGAFLIDWAQ